MNAWTDKALNFFRYLLGKSSDLRDLDRDDVRLGKIVLDIHRKKTEAELATVPIGDILPIHPIDREEAVETLKQRASTVATHRTDIERQGKVSREFLHEFLPSVSDIKVADLGDGHYVAFEGNGRLAALREGLGADTALPVEVERYRFSTRDRNRFRRQIDRLRRRNGAAAGDPSP